VYSSQCSGVHFPFLPADEFFDRSHFPWLEKVEKKTEAIRLELQSILNDRLELRPYVEQKSGTPPNKWTPLDGSLDWGTFFLWEYGVRIEEACARCPETIAALASVPQTVLPGRAPTAFFSLLKPKTRIPPHTGVTNTRAIIHLPLIVPPGCGFRVGGEVREWRVGEALAFDDTIEHEAWNDSDELRAVLIFDVWNPYLTASESRLMQRFFDAADANDPDALKSSVTGQRRI
jgi:aspartyl/asparaginyl beta-hydroxylase (cupin superfamily)